MNTLQILKRSADSKAMPKPFGPGGMEIAVNWGRKTNPDLHVGICGEQGGHPESVRFCHHIGLTYVSCSAPRVPIARLAAAQAKLTEQDYVLE